jgi:integrase
MYGQLIEFELLDAKQVAAGKPLMEHIDDFEKSLLVKGRNEEYARLTTARARRVIEECGFVNWSDISASTVLQKIVDLRKYVEVMKVEKINGKKVKKKEPKDLGPISTKSKNYYLQAVKQFCKWMVLDTRASESPVGHLQSIDTTSDECNERRALELDEMRLLLETTQIGPDRFGIIGIERAMLYRVAAETGLRANELRSLKKLSFDFENCTVTVKVGYTKNSKKAALPLRKNTAVAL